ncbi:MAG TPA: L,D-transpeptidase [Solirubrobacteraceae bacterium]|nr:L,D-transpeptidase [Solirubrobacteraceae bacterium]
MSPRRCLAGLAVTFGVGLIWATPSLAGTATTPSTPATSGAGSTTTGALAVPGSATIYLPDVFFVEHRAVTVPRRSFHVVGIVRPYLPGQSLTVQARLGQRVIRTEKVTPIASANRTYGHFRLRLVSPAAGRLSVLVTHVASPQLRAFSARRTVAVVNERAGPGATGTFVRLVQQRLRTLHFYVPQTGVYDQGTEWAIDAYHRLLRWGTSRSLDGRTTSFLLDGFGSFRVRFPHHGRHAEGNLSLQLLALIDSDHVDAIYPISSGKPSTPTILGDFHVYSKVPGYLPDGMYYSNFFIRGYAIHGYDPAPDYPASHGCMRLPISDATSVYGWLAIGDWVDVYG